MSWISWLNYSIYSNKRSTSNSAHLEKAAILEAEKVNKRPASNKRPPLPFPFKLK